MVALRMLKHATGERVHVRGEVFWTMPSDSIKGATNYGITLDCPEDKFWHQTQVIVTRLPDGKTHPAWIEFVQR